MEGYTKIGVTKEAQEYMEKIATKEADRIITPGEEAALNAIADFSNKMELSLGVQVKVVNGQSFMKKVEPDFEPLLDLLESNSFFVGIFNQMTAGVANGAIHRKKVMDMLARG